MPLFSKHKKSDAGLGGLILFHKVEEAIRAEKHLVARGYSTKLVAPPPELRKGCDLSVEINLSEQPGIERYLWKKDIPFIEVVPLKGERELLDLVKVTRFPDSIMVKAGNMKLTFDPATGEILNTSGGGCPDIPYLSLELVGKKLTEVPLPRDIGYTLCAMMLDRALAEALQMQERK